MTLQEEYKRDARAIAERHAEQRRVRYRREHEMYVAKYVLDGLAVIAMVLIVGIMLFMG